MALHAGAAGAGEIAGTLLYSDSRRPIPYTPVEACAQSGPCRDTTTDSQGNFMFRDLAPARYSVRAPESSRSRALQVTVGSGRETVTIFGN